MLHGFVVLTEVTGENSQIIKYGLSAVDMQSSFSQVRES